MNKKNQKEKFLFNTTSTNSLTPPPINPTQLFLEEIKKEDLLKPPSTSTSTSNSIHTLNSDDIFLPSMLFYSLDIKFQLNFLISRFPNEKDFFLQPISWLVLAKLFESESENLIANECYIKLSEFFYLLNNKLMTETSTKKNAIKYSTKKSDNSYSDESFNFLFSRTKIFLLISYISIAKNSFLFSHYQNTLKYMNHALIIDKFHKQLRNLLIYYTNQVVQEFILEEREKIKDSQIIGDENEASDDGILRTNSNENILSNPSGSRIGSPFSQSRPFSSNGSENQISRVLSNGSNSSIESILIIAESKNKIIYQNVEKKLEDFFTNLNSLNDYNLFIHSHFLISGSMNKTLNSLISNRQDKLNASNSIINIKKKMFHNFIDPRRWDHLERSSVKKILSWWRTRCWSKSFIDRLKQVVINELEQKLYTEPYYILKKTQDEHTSQSIVSSSTSSVSSSVNTTSLPDKRSLKSKENEKGKRKVSSLFKSKKEIKEVIVEIKEEEDDPQLINEKKLQEFLAIPNPFALNSLNLPKETSETPILNTTLVLFFPYYYPPLRLALARLNPQFRILASLEHHSATLIQQLWRKKGNPFSKYQIWNTYWKNTLMDEISNKIQSIGTYGIVLPSDSPYAGSPARSNSIVCSPQKSVTDELEDFNQIDSDLDKALNSIDSGSSISSSSSIVSGSSSSSVVSYEDSETKFVEDLPDTLIDPDSMVNSFIIKQWYNKSLRKEILLILYKHFILPPVDINELKNWLSDSILSSIPTSNTLSSNMIAGQGLGIKLSEEKKQLKIITKFHYWKYLVKDVIVEPVKKESIFDFHSGIKVEIPLSPDKQSISPFGGLNDKLNPTSSNSSSQLVSTTILIKIINKFISEFKAIKIIEKNVRVFLLKNNLFYRMLLKKTAHNHIITINYYNKKKKLKELEYYAR